MTTCPWCDAPADNVADEIAHMKIEHPDVVANRLRELVGPPWPWPESEPEAPWD